MTEHLLYSVGQPDPRAPAQIKDHNGVVVLQLCKRCCRAEGELGEECVPPDRVSIETDSPFFNPYVRKMGVKFNDRVIFNCKEFCTSESWVELLVPLQGRGFRRGYKRERGRLVSVRHYGKVEPYWR